jgi:hypothetical protein
VILYFFLRFRNINLNFKETFFFRNSWNFFRQFLWIIAITGKLMFFRIYMWNSIKLPEIAKIHKQCTAKEFHVKSSISWLPDFYYADFITGKIIDSKKNVINLLCGIKKKKLRIKQNLFQIYKFTWKTIYGRLHHLTIPCFLSLYKNNIQFF